ncbi:hypothetical protein AYO38_04590 [bacterium SCGC AG-212-C10]|nr:hypothetical protein AYO38_04590 [bacterium SCGC AG-212-C10]
MDTSRVDLERSGARFSPQSDDLDSFIEAEFQDPRAGHVVVMRRDHAPIDGFQVLVDTGVSRGRALKAIKRLFGVDRERLLWVTSYAHDPMGGPVTKKTGPSGKLPLHSRQRSATSRLRAHKAARQSMRKRQLVISK